MAIPIPTQVVSHSFPFTFPILSPIPITMGIPWDSHSLWESHSHGHLWFTLSYERVLSWFESDVILDTPAGLRTRRLSSRMMHVSYSPDASQQLNWTTEGATFTVTYDVLHQLDAGQIQVSPRHSQLCGR